MERRYRYGEGEEKKLRPTSFFARRLAEPHPQDKTRRLYDTDMSLIEKVVRETPGVSPEKLRGTINLARYNFAIRVFLPETMSQKTALEHEKDMEYIRNCYPEQVLSDMDILQMLERSDGTGTNFELIRSRGKQEPTPTPTVAGKVDLSDWNEKFGHDWFEDVKDAFKNPAPSPYMGEKTSEVRAPKDLDRPLPDHNSVIFVDNG